MLVVDGSRGEGGGQVARLALALAAATRREVRVHSIRAGRTQPGLKAGHVAAFLALAELSQGEIDGAYRGSTEVDFRPGVVMGGEYEFAIETAGPVTLFVQALLPAMVASRQEFTLRLRGGTNVAWSPQWDDMQHVHFPLLARIGIEVDSELLRRGFFPQGGGEVTLLVATPALHHVRLVEPGEVRSVHAIIPSHGLPRHVMERASISVAEAFPTARIETDFHRGPGTGMAVAMWAECANTVLGADAVGRKGVRVEDVVASATAGLAAELRVGAGVDVHQADQLPVFLALAGRGEFTARHLTRHARTVLDLLPEFLPVKVETRVEGALTRVAIQSQ